MQLMEAKRKSTLDVPEKRFQKCNSFMRKFWKAHRTECKVAKEEYSSNDCLERTFPTGSKYAGAMLGPSMNGFGTYTFPNGVKYVGEFKDNQCHGNGELIYKNDLIVRGVWKEGVLSQREIIFPSGLIYEEKHWMYCRSSDRRFAIEYEKHLQPAGNSYQTEEQPTKKVPVGHYDTGDGYYDPESFVVKKMDLVTVIRAPQVPEQNWITKNCRFGCDRSIGPCPDLYEEWSKPTRVKRVPRPPVRLMRGTDESYSRSSIYFEDTDSSERRLISKLKMMSVSSTN